VEKERGSLQFAIWGYSYIERGDHEPQEENCLEEEVEGEPVQQNIGEGLEDGDESIDGPKKSRKQDG